MPNESNESNESDVRCRALTKFAPVPTMAAMMKRTPALCSLAIFLGAAFGACKTQHKPREPEMRFTARISLPPVAERVRDGHNDAFPATGGFAPESPRTAPTSSEAMRRLQIRY
jgi:hypothetical protein